MRATLRPDPEHVRVAESRSIPFRSVPSAAAPDMHIQPIMWIHDQGQTPSCAGQSTAACIEQDAGERLSGVELWRESLRRLGTAVSMDEGTYIYAVGEGAVERGCVPYREGEQDDVAWVLRSTDQPGLACELDASVRRVPAPQRVRIDAVGADRLTALVDALGRGLRVCAGGPITARLQARTRDMAGTIAYDDEVWGQRDSIGGHAMRIAGYWRRPDGSTLGLIQNSWGPDWGGAWVPGGVSVPSIAIPQPGGYIVPGCVWVDSSVLMSAYAWDFHAYYGGLT